MFSVTKKMKNLYIVIFGKCKKFGKPKIYIIIYYYIITLKIRQSKI